MSSWGLVLVCIGLGACAGAEAKEPRVAVPDRPGADKTAAALRAERRAYDGAPPTIPHDSFGIPCVDCHNERGIAVKEVGFAPPMPHAVTAGLSAISRCQQCHVFRKTDEVFAANRFVGLPQDLRRGDRMHAPAPPVMPHPAFMRENCQACHDGPAAREEIRTPHPERVRCGQCHAERTVTTLFEPALQGAAN